MNVIASLYPQNKLEFFIELPYFDQNISVVFEIFMIKGL